MNTIWRSTKKYILVFLIVLLFLYLFRPFFQINREPLPSESGTSSALINEQPLVQPFILKDPSRSIAFRIATFLQVIDSGSLKVRIYDSDSGEIKASKEFGTAELLDNHILKVEAMLDPGKYWIEITPVEIEEGKSLVIYTSTSTDLPCSINGVQQSNEIYLRINKRPDEKAIKAFIMLSSGIVLIMGVILVVQLTGELRAGTDKKIKTVGQYAACFICLVASVVVLCIHFQTMITNNATTFMREERECFYLVVVLIGVSIYILNIKSPWTGWSLIAMIGLVLIFTDAVYSVIDEGAHTEIIQYILRHKGVFPLVSENYEAVQGPLYYYITALLTGWLPYEYIYMGGRIFGLFLLILFGWMTRRTIEEIKEIGWYQGYEALLNILWMLFTINPHMLIRFTRVSNEALMCVFSATAILFVTQMIIHGWNTKNILMTTVICAMSFLTKATSAFLVILIFMVCAYYKKWKMLLLQALIYIGIVLPWFVDNIIKYGALTGMKGHLDFVMPIVNPERVMPDIRENLLYYFRSFFINIESGSWFDKPYIEGLLTPLFLLLIVVSFFVGIQYLVNFCVVRKLKYSGNEIERKRILFLSLSILPVICILMHVIQTVMTRNNSLAQNRYAIMLNSAFCSMILLGMSSLSDHSKKILNSIITAIYSFYIVSMICGYTEISMHGIFGV